MKGLVLDAGALIAIERNDRKVSEGLAILHQRDLPIVIPAGALAQVWRDGRVQARLARFLSASETPIIALDEVAARRAGELCGLRRTSDVVDASVVLCAIERGYAVMTSDPDDLARLDPKLELIAI